MLGMSCSVHQAAPPSPYSYTDRLPGQPPSQPVHTGRRRLTTRTQGPRGSLRPVPDSAGQNNLNAHATALAVVRVGCCPLPASGCFRPLYLDSPRRRGLSPQGPPQLAPGPGPCPSSSFLWLPPPFPAISGCCQRSLSGRARLRSEIRFEVGGSCDCDEAVGAYKAVCNPTGISLLRRAGSVQRGLRYAPVGDPRTPPPRAKLAWSPSPSGRTSAAEVEPRQSRVQSKSRRLEGAQGSRAEGAPRRTGRSDS
jgi:hypothetical protein